MPQKLTTFLMFQGDHAEAAMNLYTAAFDNAEILDITRYGPEGPGAEGSVERATLSIAGQELMVIDSPIPHDFDFTPSMSLYVRCETETEIARLAEILGEGGQVLMPLASYGFSDSFCWLNDRYGVSWQLDYTAVG